MGTPEFAVPSLRKLAVESSHRVVGVVTPPDRPKGRGLRVACSPVKIEALERGLPIFQPDDLLQSDFLSRLRTWGGDCFVVVGFRILPPEIFEMPPKGTINLHASLLPKYRGAAPIQWALMNGDENTGVTTFFIERRVDTGDLILQKSVSIRRDEAAGELHDRLAIVGADLLLETLDLIEQGRVKPVPQRGEPSRAPKILPEHCLIDWRRHAEAIVNQIRALSPRPGAFTTWGGKRLKVFRGVAMEDEGVETSRPGRVAAASEEGILVETPKGLVSVLELQPEGKRRMSAEVFLRGYGLSAGTVLGEWGETRIGR